MKKRSLITSMSLLATLTVAGLFMTYPTRAKGAEANDPAAEIRVDNFTFAPETLTVPANSTVTWVNKDDIPHVIASSDGLFKSKALDTDQKYSFTFTKAGTYAYYCSIHPKMVGKIVVQ